MIYHNLIHVAELAQVVESLIGITPEVTKWVLNKCLTYHVTLIKRQTMFSKYYKILICIMF